jgi:general secretion pathway protein G
MLHNHLEALRKARKGEGGFTLIELLIVIVILGVLAGIVVFSVRGITDRGDTAACKSNLKATEVAVEAYYAKTGGNPATTAALVPGYLKTDPGASPVPANQRVTYDNTTGAVTGGSAC